MNILVTGAGGQLGTSIRKLAERQKTNRFIFTDVASRPGSDIVYLDITNQDAVRLLFIAFIICLGEVGVTSARPLPWKV